MTHFNKNACGSGVVSSDRTTWLGARRGMLTASDVAAVLGEDNYRDAFSVFFEKTTPKPDEEMGLDDPRMWGLALEYPICQVVAKYEKWAGVEPGGELLISRAHPELGCTLDAEVLRTEDEGWIPYQGKTTRIDRDWDEDEQSLPTSVLLQVQTELLVTGGPLEFVFGLIQGSKPKRIVVHPQPKLMAIIVGAAEKFMEMVRRAEPPPTSARSGKALDRLFPDDDGGSVLLPREALEWTREYQAILSQERFLKDAKDEIKNKIKALIGERTYGELVEDVGGKGRWAWKRREEHLVEAHVVKAHRTLSALKGEPRARIRALPPSRETMSKLEAQSLVSQMERSLVPLAKPALRVVRSAKKLPCAVGDAHSPVDGKCEYCGITLAAGSGEVATREGAEGVHSLIPSPEPGHPPTSPPRARFQTKRKKGR